MEALKVDKKTMRLFDLLQQHPDIKDEINKFITETLKSKPPERRFDGTSQGKAYYTQYKILRKSHGIGTAGRKAVTLTAFPWVIFRENVRGVCGLYQQKT